MADTDWYYSPDGTQTIGPVAFAVLQQLTSAGQLRPTDLVIREGMPQWRTVAATPGLVAWNQGAAYAVSPAAVQSDDPLAALASAETSRSTGSSRRTLSYRTQRRGEGQSYSGYAIAGMVLSIVGMALIGVIFSGIALSGMNRSGNQEGRGMAQAGLIIGIVILGLELLWITFIFSFLTFR